MFSKALSAATCGIDSKIISVEADVSDGLPQFVMVGYLTSEVREAQDRVRTALKNAGYKLSPKKITVNLAPADIRKSGSGFDLPIAMAVMASYGYIPAECLRGIFLAGELGLDGSVRGIHGILGMVKAARDHGCTSCIIPSANIREGAVIGGIDVYGADSLQMVMDHLVSDRRMTTTSINIEEKISETPPGSCPDFSEIRGQYLARRAAEIAAAGMHNLLLSGPPGAGKTMIASRIAGILPPMDAEEALEVSQIHSVAGVLPEDGILTTRPFRMPHHTISAAAMAGGGAAPRPGEISLAHRGVLYLDELPEFQQDTLEILRQPLEEGQVRIARSSGSCTFPADFMLVASRNPCRCGYYPDRRICKCSEREVARYLHRISRPLLDRIDLHVAVEPMRYEDLESDACEETTAQIRARVLLAHERQRARYRETDCRFNADLTAAQMKRYCPLTDEASALLQKVYQQKNLTARTYHRLIRVARTIADLEGQDQITYRHISEAVLYRPDPQLM